MSYQIEWANNWKLLEDRIYFDGVTYAVVEDHETPGDASCGYFGTLEIARHYRNLPVVA
jgi:hypothetical protein